MKKLTITIPAKHLSDLDIAELKNAISVLVANTIDARRRTDLATKLKNLEPVPPSEIIVD